MSCLVKFNRPFPSSKKSHFQNEAKCETFVVKMSFICITIKNHLHIKGFALIVNLKVRFFGTRKWPIQYCHCDLNDPWQKARDLNHCGDCSDHYWKQPRTEALSLWSVAMITVIATMLVHRVVSSKPLWFLSFYSVFLAITLSCGAYPGFLSMKHAQEYCYSFPPGRDASQSHGYSPAVCRQYPFIHPGEERQSGVKSLV